MTRPEGQPGTVWSGDVREDSYFAQPPVMVTTGLTYPAVLGESLWLWRDCGWIESPGYARYFTPGAEWQAACDHEHAVPWQTCDTEADCLSLRREDELKWGDR